MVLVLFHGIEWDELGALDICIVIVGLILWFSGFFFVSLDDWISNEYNYFILLFGPGVGCILLGISTGNWEGGAIAGSACGVIFLLEVLLRGVKMSWQEFMRQGDIEAAFLACFPIGVFSSREGVDVTGRGLSVAILAIAMASIAVLGRKLFSSKTSRIRRNTIISGFRKPVLSHAYPMVMLLWISATIVWSLPNN